ncbi:MAG: AMIN domain-containing protein, partial [Zoogloea sp.]|nr:AMIN domain-containing protein [Zoogloea sp.]
MKIRSGVLVAALCLFALGAQESAWAQAEQQAAVEAANRIEKVEASEQAGSVSVRFTLAKPLAAVPASFTVANPARIAFDLPGTSNGLGHSTQVLNQGSLRSANIVQVGDRTRVVLNLDRVIPYEARVEDRALIVKLAAASRDKAASAPVASFAAEAAAPAEHNIRDITFRRGKDGEARLIVDLSDPNAGIDIRQQGGNLVLEFGRTSVPDNLRRRLDVTDFGTPVDTVLTQLQGQNARMVVTPHGKWEHNAYQSDSQFVLEVRPVRDDGRAQAKGRFQGEKLSLNFQNIDVRSVLQVIADFTNLNIVASDTVQGNLTLRLKDVPWDQALDIILQARGLDMRRNGSVIWIAPREELAAKEKLELESVAQIDELEPVHTESFQINYHKARSIADFLKTKDQSVLTKRGSVTVDERSNKLFVSDISSRLEDVRKLVTQIDVPVRQVLIEARK